MLRTEVLVGVSRRAVLAGPHLLVGHVLPQIALRTACRSGERGRRVRVVADKVPHEGLARRPGDRRVVVVVGLARVAGEALRLVPPAVVAGITRVAGRRRVGVEVGEARLALVACHLTAERDGAGGAGEALRRGLLAATITLRRQAW